jgi:Rrf2 family protein
MRMSTKAEYALRAVIELAARGGRDRAVSAEVLAEAQEIPLHTLMNVLIELRRSQILVSQRGPGGGFRLARDPKTISLADVIRAVDGPLAVVGDLKPEELTYRDSTLLLQDVWVAMRHSLRAILERVTVADISRGKLPASIRRLTLDPEDWIAR